MAFVADLRAVAKSREFRKLFVVRLSSQFSDGILQISLASFVFFSPERQTSAPAAAAAFATLLLPYSVLGPFVGVLLDRWSRRQVLVVANSIRVLLVLGVAALVQADVAGPAFYLTALACLSVNRFVLAGLSAALPHTVQADELVMANAVSPTSGTVAFLVGGSAGYALRALGPESSASSDALVIAGAAIGYAVSVALALRIRRDQLGPDYDPDRPAIRAAVRNVTLGLIDAARHVRRLPRVTYALGVITVQRIGYAFATISAILLFRNYFNPPNDPNAGLAGLASAFGAAAVGFGLAALVTPWAVDRWGKHRVIVASLVLAAVVSIVPSALYLKAAVMIAAGLLGLASQILKICVDTIVQEEVADAYRGRVFSFYDVLFNAAFVAAAVIAAVSLPANGKSYVTLTAIAIVYAVAAVGYQRLDRSASSSVPA